MKYAIIALSGSQYQIKENDVLTVDHLDSQEGDKGQVNSILLLVDGGQVTLGQPTVKDASVDYQVTKNYLGKKLQVFKYKAKSRYRKTRGFRPHLSDIKILKINPPPKST
jgi:large subunit ribosomal protein L21